MQWILVVNFSSKIERPPEQRNIGPWSARDPIGTEPPQPFLATWQKDVNVIGNFVFEFN